MQNRSDTIIAETLIHLGRSGRGWSDAPAILWDGDMTRIRWSSDGAAGAFGSAGRPRLPDRAAARLRALAAGLAPTDGPRFERLRLTADAGATPELVAVRRIPDDAGDALLTVLVDRASQPPPDRETAARPAPIASAMPPDLPDASGRPEPSDGRVAWVAAPDGVVLTVSPPGTVADGWIGRRWSDLGQPSPSLAPGRWTEGEFVPGEGGAPRVVFGAMPVVGPDGEPEGFRGFATVETSRAVAPAEPPMPPVPQSDVDNAADPGEAADPVPVGSAERLPESPGILPASRVADDAPHPEPSAASGDEPPVRVRSTSSFGALAARVGAHLGPARPLALRAVAPVGEDEAPEPRVLAGAPGAGPDASPRLSFSDHGTLREIARALGARMEIDEEAPPPVARPSAEIVPLPSRSRDGDPSRIVDRLPVPCLVLRAGQPVFANRALLSLTRDASLSDLVGRGAFSPGADGRPVVAGADGAALPIAAPAVEIEWGDLPATLATFGPAFAAGVPVGPASRDRFAGAADLAGLGTALVDGQGRLLALNGVAQAALGVHENEVAGEGFVVLFEPRSHPDAVALFEAARAGTERGGAEIGAVVTGSGGAPGRSVALRARAVEDDSVLLVWREAGAVPAVTPPASGRATEDGTGRETAFLARVSHEIRTPLTAILGFAEIMLEERLGPVGDDRYKAYLRDIRQSGEHALSLVNDMLDVAKARSGETMLSFTGFNLNAVVAQSVSLLGPSAARERVVVRSGLSAGLPRIVADERSIRQVALNLLSNAIRYTGAGGQVIVSTARTDKGEIVLRVRDTGVGMTADEVDIAMQPFKQVAGTRRSDGAGLGLPLSKALVEANQGLFSISSGRRVGTLVEVVFPPASVLAE